VLEALAEIAFAPQFLPTRVEKERKAVLAEAQVGAAAAAARRAAY
jgi:predicted Zn-dependent peptidase